MAATRAAVASAASARCGVGGFAASGPTGGNAVRAPGPDGVVTPDEADNCSHTRMVTSNAPIASNLAAPRREGNMPDVRMLLAQQPQGSIQAGYTLPTGGLTQFAPVGAGQHVLKQAMVVTPVLTLKVITVVQSSPLWLAGGPAV